MKTKDTLKAIQEYEMIDDLICFKEEVKSFNGKILNINNETYCIDNVEELKRFYINEICTKHKYTNDIVLNINSFEYRVEDFIESLYSHLISQNLISIIATAITSDIVLENFKYK